MTYNKIIVETHGLTKKVILNRPEKRNSLDEEMIAMTKYQRAYEASAKVLSTVDQLLEELLMRLG